MNELKPWDTPKIQMLLSIFSGKLISVKPINIMEVRINEEIPR
jgi:hypothetical protein